MLGREDLFIDELSMSSSSLITVATSINPFVLLLIVGQISTANESYFCLLTDELLYSGWSCKLYVPDIFRSTMLMVEVGVFPMKKVDIVQGMINAKASPLAFVVRSIVAVPEAIEHSSVAIVPRTWKCSGSMIELIYQQLTASNLDEL